MSGLTSGSCLLAPLPADPYTLIVPKIHGQMPNPLTQKEQSLQGPKASLIFHSFQSQTPWGVWGMEK